MTQWSVELIDTAKNEIAALPRDMRARFVHVVKMLEELGPRMLVCRTSGISKMTFGKCAFQVVMALPE
jgi:mRNA-degrading endonuclease RelE of RelBE toxin-antitoxin system